MLNEIGVAQIAPQAFPETNQPPVHLLLIEDSEIDVEIFKRAMRKTGVSYPITVAHDGLEALRLLRGNDEATPLERPSVALLDLNMPRMNGIEFLSRIRADRALKNSIVFVLTTSESDKDKTAAYEKNVAGYIVKSKAGEEFMDLIQTLDAYWGLIEFPPEHAV